MSETYESTNFGGSAPDTYQRFFVHSIGRPVAMDLLATANLSPPERVLDVACGTGVVTRMAAELVAPQGEVTGLDLNPGMLGVARSSTPEHLRIQWIEGSAEGMIFDDRAFDVVLCQMGLQFMSDQPAAVREMRRVLTPDGRVYANLPGPKPKLFQIMAEAMARHLGQEGAKFIDLVFSLHDGSEVRALFEQAGFRDVQVDVKSKRLVVPPPRQFLWQYIHSTPLAQLATTLDRRVRGAVERDVCPKWEEFVVDGNIHFEVGMTTVSAVR